MTELTRRLVRNASQPIKTVIARPIAHIIQENEPMKADTVSPTKPTTAMPKATNTTTLAALMPPAPGTDGIWVAPSNRALNCWPSLRNPSAITTVDTVADEEYSTTHKAGNGDGLSRWSQNSHSSSEDIRETSGHSGSNARQYRGSAKWDLAGAREAKQVSPGRVEVVDGVVAGVYTVGEILDIGATVAAIPETGGASLIAGAVIATELSVQLAASIGLAGYSFGKCVEWSMRVTAFWIFRLTLAVFALACVVVAFTTKGVLSLSAIVAGGILLAVIIAISIKTRRSADNERKDSWPFKGSAHETQ
jgi:hypothetical protein